MAFRLSCLFFFFFFFMALATAFTTPVRSFGVVSSTTTRTATMRTRESVRILPRLSMGSEDDEIENENNEDAIPEEPTKAVYKNLARGGQMEEVKWVDPAMTANTNPFEMSWWAYILFGFPFMLLANDAFHFLPTDGPLGFLGRF